LDLAAGGAAANLTVAGGYAVSYLPSENLQADFEAGEKFVGYKNIARQLSLPG